MNRLVPTKLQHLRCGFSLRRSNWHACLAVQPVARMSAANSWIPRHGISYSRVNASGSCDARAFWGKLPKSVPSFRIQKQTPPVRSGYANGNKAGVGGGYRPSPHDQAIQSSSRSPLESWTQWQVMNCSVADIGRRRGLSEFQVYEQICACVQQQGKEIDWFELCAEAGFTPAVVLEINDAKAKAEDAMNAPLGQRLDEFGHVPVQCGHHVTDVHVLLYNTMMACGITPHEMFLAPMEGLPSQVLETSSPTPKKAPLVSKTSTESRRVAGPGSGRLLNATLASSHTSRAAEEEDAKKTPPKRLTQKHMLQWMADQNGVTLMELVAEFQGYNECQLMRLILLLERKKLIQLHQGIFRVTLPDEEQTV